MNAYDKIENTGESRKSLIQKYERRKNILDKNETGQTVTPRRLPKNQ